MKESCMPIYKPVGMNRTIQRSFFVTIVLWLCSVVLTCGMPGPFRIVLLSGSDEYFSDISLENFKKHLEENAGNVLVTLLKAGGRLKEQGEYSDLQGLEALESSDVVLIFTGNVSIDGERLAALKNHVDSGKPVVAVRTARYGFQKWPEFDSMILGGIFTGQYEGTPEQAVTGPDGKAVPDPAGIVTGFTQRLDIVQENRDHPILKGVESFKSRYSLYKTGPVDPDARILMTGAIPDKRMAKADEKSIYYAQDHYVVEPAVWTRWHKASRICYIALGGLQDWDNATFRRLVTNALFWTAGKVRPDRMAPEPEQRQSPAGKVNLTMKSQKRSGKESDVWENVISEKNWNIAETAIIICNMWDKHWCTAAEKRTQTLVKKIAPVVNAARDKGIQIIHAPSNTMSFYAGWPQRQRMMLAPDAPKPSPPIAESILQSFVDNPLPIDDFDECDSEGDLGYRAWTRQTTQIDIGEFDGISDSGSEVYNFLQQQGIKNLIVLGVHVNFCCLTRSFAIKQMTTWGINTVLVRDLTDSMYNPKNYPYVSHDKGTQLVVDYIEKNWCPSMVSEDLFAALRSNE